MSRSSTLQSTSPKLRRFRWSLQGYRQDLLVAMRVVNRVEHEVYQAELEGWIRDELQKCEQVTDLLQSNHTTKATQFHGSQEIQNRLQEYCGSCREGLARSEARPECN